MRLHGTQQFSVDLDRWSFFLHLIYHILTGYHTVAAVHILITIVDIHYLPRKSAKVSKIPFRSAGIIVGCLLLFCVFAGDCITSFGVMPNT